MTSNANPSNGRNQAVKPGHDGARLPLPPGAGDTTPPTGSPGIADAVAGLIRTVSGLLVTGAVLGVLWFLPWWIHLAAGWFGG
jgi:hypothetical protein